MENICIYQGKVRNVYDMGNNILLMEATDRISCFDKHIADIQDKGIILNKISEFWFNITRSIINNHLISANDRFSLVKKTMPFKIEFVVRGYITGNTETSLWRHYYNGERLYCGIQFPDGLTKNQRIEAIVTPTTKGKHDYPISKADIIVQNYMTQLECDYLYSKSLELFKFVQEIADKAGLILVDTKYEFGKTPNGDIILIDELHTCDSSRYWIKETYMDRYYNGIDPEKLDKDCMRDWINSQCDPYNDMIPEIPESIIVKVQNVYKYFYTKIISLTNNYNNGITHEDNNLVVILSGSEKDSEHTLEIMENLDITNIKYTDHILSAHKNTQELLNTIKTYETMNKNIIWVTIAGKSNALSGVVAANSIYPVIACPPFSDNLDFMLNINSSLICPSNVSVMTILEPSNVAHAIKKIFNMNFLKI